MAESTPPSRARLDDDLPRSSRPLRLIDPGMRATQPSHPPSEPRPIAGRPGADASPDRPARVQLIAALLLLLVLVVVPLYLWRRPRAAATDEAKPNASALASAQIAEPPAPTADPKVHAKDGVTVSDAKVIGCHDQGSRRTAPGACDRLPSFESAFAKAILDSASCIPPGTPAGAIAFVADASYSRHKNPIHVKVGREGTTMHSKIAAACVADVRKALAATALDQAHGHSRYDVEIDATYASKR
jgi:hypothetical protein